MEHVIQRAAVLCEEEIIQAKHIDSKISNIEDTLRIEVPDNYYDLKKILNESKESIEKQLIEKALEVTNNNKTEAAELLGISYRALMYKINEYEI